LSNRLDALGSFLFSIRNWVEGLSARQYRLLSLVLVLSIGVADLFTGFELSFSLFYLAPISLAAWYAGGTSGLAISLMSALVWFVADIASGHTYSAQWIYLWNTLIRLGIFIAVTIILARLKIALVFEQTLARIDFLTQAINSRYFYQLVGQEIIRSRRYSHPLTLVYIDLDNFKQVNDRFGHLAGDRVLQQVVQVCKKNLRATDVVARLGGDEFVVLLPETGPSAARTVLPRLAVHLRDELRREHSFVSCSIGAVSCEDEIPEAVELVKWADRAMYTAKSAGKDQIEFVTFGPTPE
jgi:diguanylate cyclase (GGDEF)-like protein